MTPNMIVINGGAWLFDSTGYPVRAAILTAVDHYARHTGRRAKTVELSSARYDELVDYLFKAAVDNGDQARLIPAFPLRMIGPWGPFDVVSA